MQKKESKVELILAMIFCLMVVQMWMDYLNSGGLSPQVVYNVEKMKVIKGCHQ